jgi:hypothetical protein
MVAPPSDLVRSHRAASFSYSTTSRLKWLLPTRHPRQPFAEAHARAKANQGWDAAASKTTCWLAMRTLASFVFFCHERASSSYTRRDRRSGLIELGYEMRSAGLGRYRKLAKRSVADTSSSATDKPAARGLGALGRSETWPGKESAGL